MPRGLLFATTVAPASSLVVIVVVGLAAPASPGVALLGFLLAPTLTLWYAREREITYERACGMMALSLIVTGIALGAVIVVLAFAYSYGMKDF